jgi:energy-coupling factor transporter transmembrane protein EcfT
MMPIFVAMIITALRTSSQLAMAIEARAFGVTGQKRSTLYDLQAGKMDFVWTAVILLLTLSLTYLYFAYGFGTHPIELLKHTGDLITTRAG